MKHRGAGIVRSGAIATVCAFALITSCANDTATKEADSHPSLAGWSSGKVGSGGSDATTKATFTVHGSIDQANVIDAAPGARLELLDSTERTVRRTKAGTAGSAVFYDVDSGDGYRIRQRNGDKISVSAPFTVLDREDTPATSLYSEQTFSPGLNYISMRDGIELAMTLRLPVGKAFEDGPFPTLVEYSGYEVAPPHDLLAAQTARIANPDTPPDPLAPSTSTAVGALISPLLGFAVVSVQIRGTGCSGGAFDLFGLPTIYDGYDAIETVAAQPWVKNNKVGMVGISYSGFSQLYVGGTHPPHLAALAPMSVTDDLYDGIGFPGGIFNTGFAQGWLTERQHDAVAAPEGGQEWAKVMIEDGDENCLENQKLHHAARDGLEILSDVEFRDPDLFTDRLPGTWGKDIEVPTFLVGGLQDEQLGSHWLKIVPELADNPDTWVTIYNGNHNDALQPAILGRWVDFLNLFVADQVPVIPEGVLALASTLFDEISHVPSVPLEQSRFAGYTDVETARNDFRKDPRVRILLDVGGGSLGPGALQPGWETTSSAWPIPGTTPQRWYLGDDGKLSSTSPTGTSGTDSYLADPAARPETSEDRSEDAAPRAFPDLPNNWTPVADGAGLGYVSAPLAEDVFIAGTSSLDVQITASAKNTDLQATLSEVRPDGQETYVETGWLRATHRKLDDKASTETDPVPTHLETDAAPLSQTTPSLVRVSINPVAHLFRAGSRIRVTLQAPGGDRPAWKFRTVDAGSTTVNVLRTAASPSSLVLPVVPGVTTTNPLPACDTLRGQPCRDYVTASNGG